MDNSKLTTVLVLFLAVAGLAITYFAVENIDPIELNIGAIEDSMNGKLVKIIGTINNIRKSQSGNSYWTVSDDSNDAGITVPILDSKFKKIVPKRGDAVEIVGLVTKYKDELEVMPKEIYIK